MEFPPPQEFRGDVESHPPQDGYARGQRAGRSRRSTMDIRDAASHMAPWIWQLISPSIPPDQDARRSMMVWMTKMTRTLAEQVAADIPDDMLSRDPHMMEWMTRMTRTLAEQVAADIPDDVLSRDPQQHDLAAQQILICGL